MTTIVALAARDFIVVGADSLATTSLGLVNPADISAEFFDSAGNLKLDSDGKPILAQSSQLWASASSRPVNQLPSVTKLFSLGPKNAAALFAGASRIGDVSIRNLVEQFIEAAGYGLASSYTVKALADEFRDFIVGIYEREIDDAHLRPAIEVLMAGYSSTSRQPEIYRILCQWDWSKNAFLADVTNEVEPGTYNVVFGGQYDVIQRVVHVVHGVDVNSWRALKLRSMEVLQAYKNKIQSDLAAHGHPTAILEPDANDPDLDLFARNFGGVAGIFADVSDLSEQAGIDFVRFLIFTMIKAQEFSSSIPTVGGQIHLAALTKRAGFEWVSQPYLRRAGDSSDTQQ